MVILLFSGIFVTFTVMGFGSVCLGCFYFVVYGWLGGLECRWKLVIAGSGNGSTRSMTKFHTYYLHLAWGSFTSVYDFLRGRG